MRGWVAVAESPFKVAWPSSLTREKRSEQPSSKDAIFRSESKNAKNSLFGKEGHLFAKEGHLFLKQGHLQKREHYLRMCTNPSGTYISIPKMAYIQILSNWITSNDVREIAGIKKKQFCIPLPSELCVIIFSSNKAVSYTYGSVYR